MHRTLPTARRLVVATADRAALPAKATWYLVTSLPRPGRLREADSPYPAQGTIRRSGAAQLMEEWITIGWPLLR